MDLQPDLPYVLREFVQGDYSKWQWIGGRCALLVKSLRRMVCDALGPTSMADPASMMQTCWEYLSEARAAPVLKKYCDEVFRFDRVSDRLLRNARALVATAAAAIAAKQARSHDDAVSRLVHWCREAAALFAAAPPTGDIQLEARWTDAEPERLIDQAYDLLVRLGWNVAAARFWTLHWLDAEQRQVVATLTAPIVGYESGDLGFLADLHLAEVAPDRNRSVPSTHLASRTSQPGSETVGQFAPAAPASVEPTLFEHPDMALQPLDGELLGALAEAARRGHAAACWRITLDPADFANRAGEDSSQTVTVPLKGDSLGAAATIAFTALGQQLIYDSSCLITGAVDGDRIKKVGEEKQKLDRAAQSGRFRLALIPADSDLAPTTLEQYKGTQERPFRVERVATVEDALRHVSLLATGFRAYLEVVIAAPDRDPLPAYMGDRPRTELFVEPDVFKRERRTERFRVEPAGGDAESRAGPGRTVAMRRPGARMPAAEALDYGDEALFGEQQVETQRRVSWAGEFNAMRPDRSHGTAAARRAVVLAPPGQGKSLLVQMTARTLALEAAHALDGNRSPTRQRGEPDDPSLARFEVALLGGRVAEIARFRGVGSLAGCQNSGEFCYETDSATSKLARRASMADDRQTGEGRPGDSVRRGLNDVPLPIVVRLSDLAAGASDADAEQSLRASLRKALRQTCGEALLPGADKRQADEVADYLADHAHDPRAWLFLDALDEVTNPDALIPVFRALKNWQCRVVITSRRYGYENLKLAFDVTEYQLAEFTRQQSNELADCWFSVARPESAKGVDAHGRHETTPVEDSGRATQPLGGQSSVTPQRQRFRELLERSPAVQQLAQNPFLLTLLCWVVSRRDVPDDVTRTALYERVVRDMLGMLKDGTRLDEARAESLLPLAEDVAAAFGDATARAIISNSQLKQAIERSPNRPLPLGVDAAGAVKLTVPQQAEAFIAEFCDKRLLAPLSHDRAAYVAPHRSVIEFLAAHRMAKQLDACSASEAGDVLTIADRLAWDPAREQVLLFLAGLLSDPAPLFRVLLARDAKAAGTWQQIADAGPGDDEFRHRLGLAARCLAELTSSLRSQCPELIDAVTHTVFLRWWDGHQCRTSAAVAQLQQSLPALAECNGRVDPALVVRRERRQAKTADSKRMPLLSALTESLRDPDESVRYAAAVALGALGERATSAEVLGHLTACLRDPEGDVRYAAAQALGALGERAGTPDVIDRLTHCLRDTESNVRVAAADALAAMGERAATPEVLDRLTECLRDVEPDKLVERQQLGERNCWQQLGERIQQLRSRVDAWKAAAAALGVMGGRAVTARLIDQLTDCLCHPLLGCAAAEVLAGLGERAAKPEVLSRLTECLLFSEGEMRVAAVVALETLQEPSATARVIDQLVEQLAVPGVIRPTVGLLVPYDTGSFDAIRDRFVRYAVAVLGALGERAATPQVIARLTECLRDQDSHVRIGAAKALVAMGKHAATPQVIERLTEFLFRRNHVFLAFGWLGAIGERAATPQVIARLTECLRDQESDVRIGAAQALAAMGKHAAVPEVLGCLTECLRNPEWLVRSAAAEGLGALGERVATAEVLGRLTECLRDLDGNVRYAAAEALGKWMTKGLRFFRSLSARGSETTWRVSAVAQLARGE